MVSTNKAEVHDSIVFNDSHNKTIIVIVKWTWLKAGTDQKTDLWTDWLNFIEKIYYTIVDLFCRYKSVDNMMIAYTNCL